MTRGTDTAGGGVALAFFVLLGLAGAVTASGITSEMDAGLILSAFGALVGLVAVPLGFIAVLALWDFLSIAALAAWKGAGNRLVRIEERAPVFGGVLNTMASVVGGALVVYVSICTLTLVLFFIPNVYLSKWVIETFGLEGWNAVAVLASNMLAGMLGLGVTQAKDDPTKPH